MKLRKLKEILNAIPDEFLDLEAVNYDNNDESLNYISVVELVLNNYELCVSVSSCPKYTEYTLDGYEELDAVVGRFLED